MKNKNNELDTNEVENKNQKKPPFEWNKIIQNKRNFEFRSIKYASVTAKIVLNAITIKQPPRIDFFQFKGLLQFP